MPASSSSESRAAIETAFTRFGSRLPNQSLELPPDELPELELPELELPELPELELPELVLAAGVVGLLASFAAGAASDDLVSVLVLLSLPPSFFAAGFTDE